MPKGNALTCDQCHTATATQMNLKGMGYAMRGTQETTCTQCHEREEMPSYTKLHDKHVKDKKYDCSWCHSFSRPERGLKMPPGTTSPAAPDIATTGSLDFGSVKVKGWVTTFIRCLGIYPPVTIPQRRYQSIDRPQS